MSGCINYNSVYSNSDMSCGGNWTRGHTGTTKKEEGEENKELRVHNNGS